MPGCLQLMFIAEDLEVSLLTSNALYRKCAKLFYLSHFYLMFQFLPIAAIAENKK